MGDRGTWARYVNVALGIWLMAAPAVLGYGAPAATNDRIFGPIAATFATIALWEHTRVLRLANFGIGLWLLAAPWVLGYPTPPLANSMGVGILLLASSLVRGTIKEQFGGGWSSLWPPCRETVTGAVDERRRTKDQRRTTHDV